MSDWQDIETAPKDRTPVLIAEGDIVGEAYWDDDDDTPRWWWANTGRGDYPESSEPFPTHWMPLPAPPAR